MKPSDFYLGITEFMAVLIPGFLVSIGILEMMGDSDFARVEATMDWLVLTVAAYIIGQVLFAVGSKWDRLYDRLKGDANAEHLKAVAAVRKRISRELDCKEINLYQWSRSLLLNDYPAAFQEVVRKEADSKLFRSLLLPLIFWAVVLLIISQFAIAILSLVLAELCYWRYAGLRRKACRTAYTHVINLASRGKLQAGPS